MPVVNIAIDQLIFAQHPERSSFSDLTGLKSGRLTILGYAGSGKWYAQCTCGNITKVSTDVLIRNKSRSCGCLKKEIFVKRRTKHGHSKRKNKSPEFNTYIAMLARCNNINHSSYKNYGGRGIKVLLTFEEFLSEVGLKPSKEHTIDRINNDGNYESGNIRWALRSEQGRNKRNNVLIKYKNETKNLTQWAEALNVNYMTLWGRLYDSKMCIHHAFTLPQGSQKPKGCPDCNS